MVRANGDLRQALRLAYAVAAFVGRPNERIHPLEALALIAKHFPGISLETALAGFVFRKIWLERPLPGEDAS